MSALYFWVSRGSPGAHAVGYALVEIGGTDGGLDTPEPHPLAHLVSDAGKGKGDTSDRAATPYEPQELVAGGRIDEVHQL